MVNFNELTYRTNYVIIYYCKFTLNVRNAKQSAILTPDKLYVSTVSALIFNRMKYLTRIYSLVVVDPGRAESFPRT